MFNLEESIKEWRRQMLAIGIEPTTLVELEGHLREDIDGQMKMGMDPQKAFEAAKRKIGDAPGLKREFKKAGESLEIRFAQLVGFAVAAIAFLFSLWILPFLFTLETSLITKTLGLAAVVTTVLSWRYNYKFLPVIGHSWVRAALGTVCCVAGFLWMKFFIHLLPNFLVWAFKTETSRGWFFVSFLWAFSIVAILGAIIFGLEKAARRKPAAV
ncbi:MAG TPA: hypothetical protein VGN23_00895 [Verrucomicrobiae bacterium]|jgi:hypothetical protein